MNSFLDALYEKYGDDGELGVIELPQNDGHRRVAEYVGFDQLISKLKNVTNLQFINLSDMCVSHCDVLDEKLRFPKAYSLDLSLNQIKTWLEVSRIVLLMTSLRELMLTSNPLQVPNSDDINEIGTTCQNLHTVVLGNLSYAWQDVKKCLALFPEVEKLSLFENKVTQIDLKGDCLQNLKFLSLSKNPIVDWNEIAKLGILKNLETLELPNCQISRIEFVDDTLGKTSLFPKLQWLDLSHNQINDWRSVAQLNKLRGLNTLLLKKNPIYDRNQYYYNFNFVISRIKSLTKLDREPITKEARSDGEKYYLRVIYPEYLNKSDSESRKLFLEENPCFPELLQRIGEPVVAKVLTNEEKIKQNFLVLNIFDAENEDPNKRELRKQFPKTIKVSNLKFILRRLLKIDMQHEFNLIITSKDYAEELEERNEVQMYRQDEDSVIHIKRL